jgi:hypothetical protein
MKILHFAFENYARIPSTLVRAERELGHESFLVTAYDTFQEYKENDYCLNLPFVGKKYITFIKRVILPQTLKMNGKRQIESGIPPIWRSPNKLVNWLIRLRDDLWESKVREFLKEINIESFDVLILDGGAGFLRSGKIIQELKQQGIRIAVYYCGSDFRTRGIIRCIDNLADYRFTFEFDHTLLDDTLPFLFAPFQLPGGVENLHQKNDKVRIGHAPTKRKVKGTDIILGVLSLLKEKYPIEIVLIENLPYKEALNLKTSCDIFIDSIGEIGYGINSLESLAMGIPTAVEILPDLEELLGEHPLINISASNMDETLIPYIEKEQLRSELGIRSKEWVRQIHNPIDIAKNILDNI